ncbi:hypothetical protein [Priestia megaterium]|uniref:hypothetical protein n=1 Tax=Priestia megaterium TaxID=1404 RepID=UPI003100DC5B
MSEFQYEGECHGCFMIKKVNHIPFCESCNSKMERDLVRQRSYDYSELTVHLSSKEAKENVRKNIIFKYGPKLEIVIDEKYDPSN